MGVAARVPSMSSVDALAEMVEQAAHRRRRSLESATMSVLMIQLLGALWLLQPTVGSLLEGQQRPLGPETVGGAILALLFALILLDLVDDAPRTRTRVAALATIGAPAFAVIAIAAYQPDLAGAVAFATFIVVGGIAYQHSERTLRGRLDVMRFRSSMGILGVILSLSLTLGLGLEGVPLIGAGAVMVLGLVRSGADWFLLDDDRSERRRFARRLDDLEARLLDLRAAGAPVDQAASLAMTAAEEGHLDPEYGHRLIDHAEEDIERSLALSEDIGIIESESRASIEEAERIAPEVRRPRSAFDQGIRERELGSLREAESLFRQAKKRALEVIEWWAVARDAIEDAEAALGAASGENVADLKDQVAEARRMLRKERLKEAAELAASIPAQVEAVGEVLLRAESVIAEAASDLERAEGMVLDDLNARLEQARSALGAGDASTAIGLADGIRRSLVEDREAMDVVRRAMKGRTTLMKRIKERPDAEAWHARLQIVDDAMARQEWTVARAELERLTSGLDRHADAVKEATEMLAFVEEIWGTLRNQALASSIPADDEGMIEIDAAVGRAREAIQEGRHEDGLRELGVSDEAMERLRRRV